ncbi:MAG: hypothetical protein H0U23_02490 [Blastocatellia bacterium]|nr:hypothetical protein [Blastocatellia bacterium]
MHQFLSACLTAATLFLLTGCATNDDDPFPQHPSAADDEPVPGATAAPRESANAGWKW